MLKYVAAALLAATAVSPAAAQSAPANSDRAATKYWAFAESDRFRVYSEGGEEAARSMAIKLERLDDAMRLFTGVKPPAGPTPSNGKVTLYQFGSSDDIGGLINAPGVYGFFISRAGDSVAYVPLMADRKKQSTASPGARQSYDFGPDGIDPEPVLFHEYAHYFMYYHRPAAYPMWYSEGFAELFGTIKLDEKGFALGEAPRHRDVEFRMVDVSTAKMFDSKSSFATFPYYGHGWLAVSYLTFKPERKGQLAKYLTALQRGVDGKTAAQDAFGDLGKLERELNAYRRERAMGMRAEYPMQGEPRVTVRKLTEAEAAAMQIVAQADVGLSREKARGLVDDARRVAAQYPQSVRVQLVAVETELAAGNLDEAEKRAAAIVAANPKTVDAHLFRAMVAMERAKSDPKWLATARAHYIAANNVDENEPRALAGYYATYVLAKETPPEGALAALESAFTAAPFDDDIRRKLAHLLLLENKDAQAKMIIAPIAFWPHANKEGKRLRELLAGLDRGERQPLIDELAPSLKPKRRDI
ncbi:hypothetical protein [Qipengyuania sediminis]|uniref:hypothetical protein n=1 Tax=Qipengyuania sediminis TaxID=1532023 RepID=UPI001059DCB7|nr:hypothetical protein [Qipengyuania sediminis]